MPLTKSLALTATPQNIVVQSVCRAVTIKEDESVANWPTVALNFSSVGGATDQRTAGKSITINALGTRFFQPGDVVGQISLPSGSTTGIQYEE
jgi:hypothetical protein